MALEQRKPALLGEVINISISLCHAHSHKNGGARKGEIEKRALKFFVQKKVFKFDSALKEKQN